MLNLNLLHLLHNVFCSLKLSLWLRDILDDLCHRKIRDIADFEWQRFLRPYLEDGEEGTQLVLRCVVM